MAPRKDRPTNPIRALIWDRAKELDIKFKELSLLAQKNTAYIQQYVQRGSPRELPEDVRKVVALELGIPEEDLMSPDLQNRIKVKSTIQRAPRPAPFRLPMQSGSHIPVYNIGDQTNPDRANDWVERPGVYAGAGQSFAVWVRGRFGRLNTGDLAVIRPNVPVRPGDYAVILDDEHIRTIGEVTAADDKEVTLKMGNQETIYRISSFKALKVSTVILP